jgi:hypothetical protein
MTFEPKRIVLFTFSTTTNYSNIVNTGFTANNLCVSNVGDEQCFISFDGSNDYLSIAPTTTVVINDLPSMNSLAVKSATAGKIVYITAWKSKER